MDLFMGGPRPEKLYSAGPTKIPAWSKRLEGIHK